MKRQRSLPPTNSTCNGGPGASQMAVIALLTVGIRLDRWGAVFARLMAPTFGGKLEPIAYLKHFNAW